MILILLQPWSPPKVILILLQENDSDSEKNDSGPPAEKMMLILLQENDYDPAKNDSGTPAEKMIPILLQENDSDSDENHSDSGTSDSGSVAKSQPPAVFSFVFPKENDKPFKIPRLRRIFPFVFA